MTPDTNSVFRQRLRRMDPLAYRLFAELAQMQVGRRTLVSVPGAGPVVLDPGSLITSWPELCQRLEYDWNRTVKQPTIQQMREAMHRLSTPWPEGTTTDIATGLVTVTTTGKRLRVTLHYKAKTVHQPAELQQVNGPQPQQISQQVFRQRRRGVMEDEHGNRIYAKD